MEFSKVKWDGFIRSFRELGGVFQNACLQEGDLGRGIFPVDPSLPTKIFTPKSLLLNRDKIEIQKGGNLAINGRESFPSLELDFLESYYSEISWGCGGSKNAQLFLEKLMLIPDNVRLQLARVGFIPSNLLISKLDDASIFYRFKCERSVLFKKQSVLAPFWEMVNHSSYAPSLRVTPAGVETPPISPSNREILFKYSKTNSAIYMWANYGFACHCLWAYSIPFRKKVGSKQFIIVCEGHQKQSFVNERGFVIKASGEMVFDSLIIGCLSRSLPHNVFSSALISLGVSRDEAIELMEEIQDLNIKTRREILSVIKLLAENPAAELIKSVEYDIDLIRNSKYSSIKV